MSRLGGAKLYGVSIGGYGGFEMSKWQTQETSGRAAVNRLVCSLSIPVSLLAEAGLKGP